MKYVEDFNDYEVLTCGNFEKIERFGKYILRRPDPQSIWPMDNEDKYTLNAHYHRSKSGGGSWEFFDLPESWKIKYELDKENKKIMVFNLKPFSFKHTGVFPEQATNWNYIYNFVNKYKKDNEDFKVLNLFAYTGGATIAAALAGAKVTHVDSSKGIVTWAKENIISSHIPDDRVRYIVDDAVKFVEREIRRGNIYDAIIMDPPSYGRGPNNEIWKIEDSIYDFVELVSHIINENNSFVMLNSYTTGLQVSTMEYVIKKAFNKKGLSGSGEGYEIGLKVKDTGLILPEGSTYVYNIGV